MTTSERVTTATHASVHATGRRPGAALACVVLVVALLVRAPIAEDWDGLGFVSAVKTFDLAAFSPHPPGYPVYVAVLRLAALLFRDPALAGAVVSAVSGALCAYYTFSILAPRVGLIPAWCGASCGALGSLVLRAASQVGTEALGLAFLLLALSLAQSGPADDVRPDPGARQRTAMWVGLVCGLGLGVRLSWWPLYLGMLALVMRRALPRAFTGLFVGVLAWAVPLALFVGPRRLIGLLAAHGEGHAQRFGRTLLHDGDVGGHLAALARDLIADGLGVDLSALGLGIAVVAALGFARFVSMWANGALRPPTALALALLSYGVFVLVFQNVIESPRHLIPIVYAGCVAAGVGLSASSPRLAGRAAHAPSIMGALLALLLGARGASDARARAAEPPLGAQVVAFARAQPGFEVGDVAIFGGDSARFAIVAGLPGGYAESVGDVGLALGSMQRLPATTLVTSELVSDPRLRSLPVEKTVCRPARLDRRHGCLRIYKLTSR